MDGELLGLSGHSLRAVCIQGLSALLDEAELVEAALSSQVLQEWWHVHSYLALGEFGRCDGFMWSYCATQTRLSKFLSYLNVPCRFWVWGTGVCEGG